MRFVYTFHYNYIHKSEKLYIRVEVIIYKSEKLCIWVGRITYIIREGCIYNSDKSFRWVWVSIVIVADKTDILSDDCTKKFWQTITTH